MKKKNKYRRTEEGDYERDISGDKIESLDNTILIVDECHSFTGNDHGVALRKIIKKSKNLKILLLSATPMKNLGDDIIELMNFLRPQNDPIKRDSLSFNSRKLYKDKFTSDNIYGEFVKFIEKNYSSRQEKE